MYKDYTKQIEYMRKYNLENKEKLKNMNKQRYEQKKKSINAYNCKMYRYRSECKRLMNIVF